MAVLPTFVNKYNTVEATIDFRFEFEINKTLKLEV